METPTGKIVGGHEAKTHSHPYLISLQTRLLWIRLHICGGALLNENWVSNYLNILSIGTYFIYILKITKIENLVKLNF